MTSRQPWLVTSIIALATVACTQHEQEPQSETVTIQSAVNSNVVVTVVDDSGAPQFDVEVMAERNGDFVASAWTNVQGKATLSLPAGSYRFATYESPVFHWSGTPGHCVTPACTSATIAQTHVDLTVVDTNGTPQAGLEVTWEDTSQNGGAGPDTDASGHSFVPTPTGASYQFNVRMNGLDFYSGPLGHCTVPSPCTTASITVTVPVTVTVVDTAGLPLANTLVEWENSAGEGGAWTNTNAAGQAQVSVTPGSTRFEVTVGGTQFWSSTGYDCIVPGCTSATVLVSAPTVVTVVNGSGAPVSGRPVTPISVEGITAGNKNTNASGQATFRLPLGHWRFRARCSGTNEPFWSGDPGHCATLHGCATSKIKMPCGQCTGQPNGAACNDQNPCSGSSTCQSQFCAGSNPMSCSASDQCHDAGACSAETAACSNPPKANGSACNDNNACTGTSSCQAGACTGGSPVTCSPSDQCHVAGTCDPATGACSNPAAADGTACNDGNTCTTPDTCVQGTCTGTPGGSCGLSPPPVDPTVATNFAAATAFLYSGSNPIQTGMSPGAIDPIRAAVVRGLVTERSGAPLAGATISVHGHPEFGHTVTRADGMFDLAVNGGGLLTIEYGMPGRLPAQRRVNVPKRDYIWAPDVVIVPLDQEMTVVTLAASGMQMAQGSVVEDADGSRQATLLVPEDTTATMVLPDGSTVPLSQMSVRLTEYTVGSTGPKAMPATLPPTSGYTYALEYSADEAIAAGAKTIQFNQPLIHYVENFIGFSSGGIVPMALYDRDIAAWVPGDNGRVVKIVEIFGGFAELDSNGDEIADDGPTLAALGVSDSERAQLAVLYSPGQTLWRVPIPHFTPVDLNWPFSPNPAEQGPGQEPKSKDDRKKDPCTKSGSIIQCENQVLGESIPITGTPFSLNYFSDRVPGFRRPNQLTIPATGSVAPAATRIEVEVQVGGRRVVTPVPTLPNQTVSFDWDGRDAFERPLQGAQRAKVVLRYVYPTTYTQPWAAVRAFGVPSSSPTAQTRQGLDVTFEQITNLSVGGWDAAAMQRMGGWNLSIHHAYSGDARQLLLASGETVRGAEGMDVTRVAGLGTWTGGSGDGGPATSAEVFPFNPVVGADGSIYFVETGIRKIAPTGTITTVFPALEQSSGNGGFAMGPDGLLFVAHGSPIHIDRISPDGTATRIAGSLDINAPSLTGDVDGLIATEQQIWQLHSLAVSDDGTVYWAGGAWVRRLTPDGLIGTVAGTGTQGFTPDGLPAKGNQVFASELVVRRGGSIVFTGQGPGGGWLVRQIEPTGVLSTVAGNGVPLNNLGGAQCFAPLDGPALTFGGSIHSPRLTIAPDDTIYISDSCGGFSPGNSPIMGVLRKLTPDSQIRTIAGGGPTPVSQLTDSPCPLCFHPINPSGSNNGGKVADVTMARQWPLFVYGGLAATSDGVYFGGVNGGHQYPTAAFLYRASSAFPGVATGVTRIPSRDGSELHEFADGRHLRTLDALTGAVKYSFGYSASGLVVTVTNADGLITTIERDTAGTATAIVAPNGQRTSLTIGSNGYLTQVTNPANDAISFTYGPTGLLATHTDLRAGHHVFTFDGDGLLTKDEGPAGSFWDVARTQNGNTLSVVMSTAEGHQETHTVTTISSGTTRGLTDANGLTAISITDPAGKTTSTEPDGTIVTTQVSPDPRFGSGAPYVSSRLVRTPGGTLNQKTVTRTATVAGASLASQNDSITVNGHTSTLGYDGASRTIAALTPAGRAHSATLDEHGRIVGLQVGNLAPASLGYDARGRLTSITMGTSPGARVASFSYDAFDRVTTATDTLSSIWTLGYDTTNRMSSLISPDGAEAMSTYNGAGQPLSVTPPERPAHLFNYTTAGQLSSYQPPPLDGSTWSTSYAYNLDQQLTLVTRPDSRTVTLGHDAAGRLSTASYDGRTVSLSYSPTGGQLNRIATTDGETIDRIYDGFLEMSDTWSGPVVGVVSRTWNGDFRIATESVNGGSTVAFTYDPDGLVTGMGAMTVTRHPSNGLVTGTALGNVVDVRSHNTFGEPTAYIASYAGSPIFERQVMRDSGGRIAQRTEAIAGVTHVFDYVYDLAGRLTDVMTDGALTASYTYHENGDRLSKVTPNGTVSGTYDNQDRLLTYGPFSYTYTANGELATKTNAGSGGVTQYTYDAVGDLRQVALPDGRVIGYDLDGIGRRIAKRINGVIVRKWIYKDDLQMVAELDANNNVTTRFVGYQYLVKGGSTYRVIKDTVGSPRLIVDANTGIVAQRIDYDEWGNVTNDTSPGFQPYGFAGGLYDPDTGLVHFGSRDYDPAIGRWLSKDTVGFAGGQRNLYTYVDGDPINRVDPTGDDFLNFIIALAGAKALGFDTDFDGAVFWAGSYNRYSATKYANCRGKKTIAMTAGGEFLEYVERYNSSLSPLDKTLLWNFASAGFAGSASGIAEAFKEPSGGGRPWSRFWGIEYPILKNWNDRVEGIEWRDWRDPCLCPKQP
jgi:RHS repeat-associated protein